MKGSKAISVQVRESVRRRVFVAAIGTLFTLDAGAFESFTFDPTKKSVQLNITAAPRGAASAASAPMGRIVVTRTANVAGVDNMRPSQALKQDAGAFVVPFSNGAATVIFVPA